MILWRFLWCCFCFWRCFWSKQDVSRNRCEHEFAFNFDPSIQLPSMPFPVHQWMQGWFRLALKASSAAHVHGLAPAWKVKKRSLSYSLARDRPLFWCRDGVPDLATVSVTVMTCSFSQVLPADWMKGNPSQTCGLLFYIFYIDFSENLNVAASITRFHQDLATIENLASDILDSVAASLKHRRPSQLLWKRLAFMTEILLQWLFPPTYKSFRTCPALESLLGCLFAARSLIWLRTRWWTPQARNMLKFILERFCFLACIDGFKTFLWKTVI